ncbi:DNA-binding PucR family transcriptional regulator [Tamaricihabitans halophyticus]|uniref:DNA-binding PucR family transcriptional regulator n=2 Tax=Tamaricihabitans halophyticus TaxID=1262583 RepID=A0A4R2R0R1_9PSEU|nr:DNA-binding PucR family transcriptional regulator [Tamaricihabitans halophyticus]
MTIERQQAPPLQWVARWLDTELDALLDSLVDGELAELPELAVARDDPRAEIRHSVRVHLIALADGLNRSPLEGELTLPAFISRHTRALARQDVPSLPALLRAFEKIHAGVWQRLTAALREGPFHVAKERRAEVLEQASAQLFAYFQLASNETASAYATERALLERRAMSQRSTVVNGLLNGSVTTTAAEQALGYDLNAVHVGYVAWVDELSDLDRLDTALATLSEHLRPRQHLSVPAGERTQFGWITCHNGSWLEILRGYRLPEGIHCAWGSPQQGADGFRASHRDALEARRVGETTGLARGNRAVLFDDVAIASLASRDLCSASAFVHRQLDKLAGTDELAGRLLETLRVYLNELASPTRAARRLHVHPNTVVKRVERIEAMLGRRVDPASLALRVAVELAPMVRLQPRSSTPLSSDPTVPVDAAPAPRASSG